jgi:hypothetical protein
LRLLGYVRRSGRSLSNRLARCGASPSCFLELGITLPTGRSSKRAANNIDAILKGAKPGDIPFYQASKFELSINLKAAKQLGISVPPALVASADNVID